MVMHAHDPRPERPLTFSHALADVLWQLGVRDAFGVCGREIGAFWSALRQTTGTEHEIATLHARHENGAGYAAYGCWAVSDRPVAAFATTGPGLTNIITSLVMARVAGAKLILLSAATSARERGRLGIQDTSPRGFYIPELYREGTLFDVAATIDTPSELDTLAGQLAMGVAAPTGFMAHLAISTALQTELVAAIPAVPQHRHTAPAPAPQLVEELLGRLARPFAVCVGWGARHYAEAIKHLLDLTGAPVVCSPRGLGIVDTHPQFLGVIGNGGRDDTLGALAARAPESLLILGSGGGEATSGWQPHLMPPGGCIHVDLDPGVFARAYPGTPALAVQADIGEVLTALLARGGGLVRRPFTPDRRSAAPLRLVPVRGPVEIHPAFVMDVIQRVVVAATDMPVLADAASAMFWGARHLTFAQPGRWLVENRFGAMGAAAAAVVGAAQGRRGPALAIVGDGAMHMQDEISTAVRYGVPAVWIVLNDSGMGIVRTGMLRNGWTDHDADYPPADFAAVARAKGAEGVRVTREEDLEAALRYALALGRPVVVDVVIDQTVQPPIGARARRE